jgi:uncharacterized protein (DUF1330 family)
MTAGLQPAFLIIKPATAEAGLVADWVNAIGMARGTILAAAPPETVEVLEIDTRHTGLIIARFAWAPDLDAFWAGAARLAAQLPVGSQVLAANGLPWEGWPGHLVPTIATVDLPVTDGPPTYMLIEGTTLDQSRMDDYRDIILPMLRARSAYYPLFELGGSVRVLHGVWQEDILAVSRWPSTALAHDFWFSDRYQNVAIPTRTGAGRFDVQLITGIAG